MYYNYVVGKKMKKNIKLVSADIDGTLLAKGDLNNLRESTKKAILDLRANGVLFGLASGRPYEDVNDIYASWGLEDQFDFLICWNGAELWDEKTKTKYEYNFLSKEDIKDIVEYMEPSNSVVNMYQPGLFYSSKVTEKAVLSAFKTNRTFKLIEDIEDYYRVDNGGIMFRSDDETVIEWEPKIAKFQKGRNFVGFKTQPNLLEFSHKDANKGYALREYCKLYNIDLDDCYAFGDTTNDNEMLKICHGVCLLNGSDDTKACAEFITDKIIEEDGFADYVYKNLL